MKTVLTIFAGRYKYLSILKNYLDLLLNKNLLYEVHLWNFARTESDYEYVINITKNNDQYKLFTPNKESIMKKWNQWAEYYEYYAITTDDYDILIKCDDDIVYIDVNSFEKFINEVKENSLYFPNIINNDVCAYIQSINNVHNLVDTIDLKLMVTGCTTPLTGWNGWFTQPEKADKIHNLFLSDRTKFIINKPNISWSSRISINMFAGTFNTIKKYFNLFKQIGNGDDEAFFSSKVCEFTKSINYIVPYFNVVHFSFGPQLVDGLDDKYVNKYYELSKQITNSKKNILFIITGNYNRSNIVDGISIRTGNVGSSGTEQSVIIVAEELVKYDYNTYIVSNSTHMGKTINGVMYTNFNLDNIDNKHFDYVITFPWINDVLSEIPIYGHVTKLFLWMQTIGVHNMNIINDFLNKKHALLQLIVPSNYVNKIIKSNVKSDIIPNPVMTNLIVNKNVIKQKHRMIFHTCWERGGVFALNIFKKLNWSDGSFNAFDYDITSENQSIDKQTLFNNLLSSEYFVYPLLNHKMNLIHKPAFSVAIMEALLCGVIVITYPIGAIKEIFGDTLIYIDYELSNEYNIVIQIEDYKKLYNNITDKFKQKIEEIDDDHELKQKMINKGINFAKTFNETDIGIQWKTQI